MTTLTVTARGQVTLRKDLLQHLGIRPGDKIRLDLLPGGRAELKADRPQGSWRALAGFLRGKTTTRTCRSRRSTMRSPRQAQRLGVGGSEDHSGHQRAAARRSG